MPIHVKRDVFCFMRYAILLLSALLFFNVLKLLYFYAPSFQCLFQQCEPINAAHRRVTVLVWLWPFNKTFDLDICRSQFNIHGCLLTADRDLYAKADAVLIHHRDIAFDGSNLPESSRPPYQKWIWMNSESPSNTDQIPGLDNLFNVSLSYRRDADISVPYGWLVPVDGELQEFVPPEKDKLVCWIVSNYDPKHKRVYYYKQIQKYIQVHVYGDVFDMHISEDEYRDIVSSCKFYLSFENSVHKDYITEKLFNALDLGAVPIVFGPSRQNYEHFIPRDAFIHVKDFPTVRALAKYLLLLDNNDAMYYRYFRWRRHFQVRTSVFPAENACHACNYIRQNTKYEVLTDLYQWYWDTNEGLDMPQFY